MVLDEADYERLLRSSAVAADASRGAKSHPLAGQPAPASPSRPASPAHTEPHPDTSTNEQSPTEAGAGAAAELSVDSNAQGSAETEQASGSLPVQKDVEEKVEEEAAADTDPALLERVICRVPKSRRWAALSLLEQLRDLDGFNADPVSLRIILDSRLLPEPDQAFTVTDLLRQTCTPGARVRLPEVLCDFLRAKGLCKFPNAKADLSRPAWETRFAFPASTMAIRWAPFVARRRSSARPVPKASK